MTGHLFTGQRIPTSLPTQLIVVLHYVHNHPIMAADALKHRKVADETLTREKFLDLFKSGHSPSTALESHRYTQYVVALVIAGIFHFSHT